MHQLFQEVLSQRDLSKAGDLFSLLDKDIEDDLSEVLRQLQVIAGSSEYLQKDNDQSVVEICVTRVTSAIRETESIEQHAEALVALLDSCLGHSLEPTGKDEDPPHAKIASDILSCIFLNHSKKPVMEKALPVAVKFLLEGNKELSKHMSSYLSLAVIENSRLLAQNMQPIIDSVLTHGNKSLLRVLPPIYERDQEPIHARVAEFVALLPNCEGTDLKNLLQLIGLIAEKKPRLLEPHTSALMELTSNSSTSVKILQVLVDMATANPEPFLSHVTKLKQTAEQQPPTLSPVARIVGAVGRISKVQAKEAVAYLIAQLGNSDNQSQPILLKEVKAICDSYPSILPEYMPEITQYSQSGSVATRMVVQQLKDLLTKSGTSVPERKTVASQTEGVVTVMPLNDLGSPQSKSVLLAHPSLTQLPNSKSASTSTREISFPNSQISLSQPKKDTAVPSSSATPSATSSALTVTPSATVASTTTSSTSTSSTPVVASVTVVGMTTSSAQTTTAVPSSSASQVLPSTQRPTEARKDLSLGRPLPLTGGGRIRREDRRSLPPVLMAYHAAQATQPHPYSGQPHAIPFRDAVQQFCEKHLSKIKSFIDHVGARLPIPIKATLEESKHKRQCLLHFICLGRAEHCLYSQSFFTYKTKLARAWIHLMFLAIQARSQKAVSQADPSVGNLKVTWDSLKHGETGNSFVRLVTSTFPSARDQDALLHELHNVRYFDVFEFNAPQSHWACFLCNHPEKATGLLQDGLPVIEGQLKEKKGRWKFLKRWKTRYFTLSGATITYSKKDSKKATISTIHTVKAVRKGMRDIPKAFEIFTNDQTYVFKSKDSKHVEQWVQCLQIALAKCQKSRKGTTVSELDIRNWNYQGAVMPGKTTSPTTSSATMTKTRASTTTTTATTTATATAVMKDPASGAVGVAPSSRMSSAVKPGKVKDPQTKL